MVSDRVVYFLFRWGQATIEAFSRILDNMTLSIGTMFDGTVLEIVVDGFDIADYSFLDLLFGPGVVLVLFISVYRFIKP